MKEIKPQLDAFNKDNPDAKEFPEELKEVALEYTQKQQRVDALVKAKEGLKIAKNNVNEWVQHYTFVEAYDLEVELTTL